MTFRGSEKNNRATGASLVDFGGVRRLARPSPCRFANQWGDGAGRRRPPRAHPQTRLARYGHRSARRGARGHARDTPVPPPPR